MNVFIALKGSHFSFLFVKFNCLFGARFDCLSVNESRWSLSNITKVCTNLKGHTMKSYYNTS